MLYVHFKHLISTFMLLSLPSIVSAGDDILHCPGPCEPHKLSCRIWGDPHVDDFTGAQTTVDIEGVVSFLNPRAKQSCLNIQSRIERVQNSGHNFYFSRGFAVKYASTLLTYNMVYNETTGYRIAFRQNCDDLRTPQVKIVSQKFDAIDILLPDRTEIWVTLNKWAPDGKTEIFFLDLHMFATDRYRSTSEGLCRNVQSPKVLVKPEANLFTKGINATLPESGNCIAVNYEGCTKTCTSKGDPHISSFDGFDYMTKGKGYYSLVDGNGVRVEAYQDTCPFPWTKATCNTIGVMKFKDYVATVRFVNVRSAQGQTRTVIDVSEKGSRPKNFILDRRNDRLVTMRSPNGVQATFLYRRGFMDISVIVPETFKNIYNDGLCGTWNNNPSDEALRRDKLAAVECRFNAKKYEDFYPDLKNTFKGDALKLAQHYRNYGMKEGRTPCGEIHQFCKWDPAVYESLYPDLKRHFNGNAERLKQHYIQHGQNEKRRLC